MSEQKYKRTIEKLLNRADIRIDGDRNWDIQVHNDEFYSRVLRSGSLGFGEAYVEGWWDCEQIDDLICRIVSAHLEEIIYRDPHFYTMIIQAFFSRVKSKLINFQSRKRAYEVAQKHYDLGNDIYQAMLDKRLVYTCGYWEHAHNLDEAQEAKLKLSCEKLQLRPGMRILDIGCGFGSFAKYACEHYDVKVVGITVSKAQLELGQQLCAGLPIELRLQDYRLLNEQFDRIVSLGMFEHVGKKNYRNYFNIAAKCLKSDGLFLLHTIGSHLKSGSDDPWINKYIFPNGYIPSLNLITKSCEKSFILEDLHNFGADYDHTLMAWSENFTQHWPQLKNQHYDEQFYRLWRYYLLSCAGCFRARGQQLWQMVLSKALTGGYRSIRFTQEIQNQSEKTQASNKNTESV